MATQAGQGLTPQQIAQQYQAGKSIDLIAQEQGTSPAIVTQMLQSAGYPNPEQNLYNNPPAAQYVQGGRPANVYSNSPMPASQSGLTPPAPPGNPPPPGFTSWAQYYQYLSNLQSSASAGGGGASSSAAADLAEKRREFDITTQRDIAKENATEVDALQKMLAGLSGPKDVYADLFFSHGLLAPQGYKPAPVPLTDAQRQAYAAMGVNQKQLQNMITGNGTPGADFGMLGNLGSSLQPPQGAAPLQPGQAPAGPQVSSNPTAQGGQLFGKAPAGSTIAGPVAPQTPAMAVGGTVPGQFGDPRLIVAHGGEEVDNDTPQGEMAPMNNQGVHPAIQRLMDALSGLLSDPDFQQFAGIAGKATAVDKSPSKSKSSKSDNSKAKPSQAPQLPPQAPQIPSQAPQIPPQGSGPQITPGGMQSMASGGVVGAPLQPTAPAVPGATGGPLGGAQGVMPFSGNATPDNPIIPLSSMDPYTRALYDVHGRLHPYSAQQLLQMGPQGQQAVESYIGKVQGGDVNAYTDLTKRLAPNGAPVAGDIQGETFTTG